MAIVLFTILGAITNAGAAYWICFAIYCMCAVVNALND